MGECLRVKVQCCVEEGNITLFASKVPTEPKVTREERRQKVSSEMLMLWAATTPTQQQQHWPIRDEYGGPGPMRGQCAYAVGHWCRSIRADLTHNHSHSHVYTHVLKFRCFVHIFWPLIGQFSYLELILTHGAWEVFRPLGSLHWHDDDDDGSLLSSLDLVHTMFSWESVFLEYHKYPGHQDSGILRIWDSGIQGLMSWTPGLRGWFRIWCKLLVVGGRDIWQSPHYEEAASPERS